MIATIMIAQQGADPFTPGQRTLILVAAAVACMLAIWFCLRGLRSFWHRQGQPNFRFVALSLMLLVCAAEAMVVLYASELVKQHPLWLPTGPMIALVCYVAAARYDDRGKASQELGSDLSISKMMAPLARLVPRQPSGHFGSLMAFYLGSETVSIVSRYDRGQAMLRLRQLNKKGKVQVIERRGGKLVAGSTRVRGNILPLFTGRLVEENGTTRLEGRIEIDRGIVIVLGMFCVLLFIVLPFRVLLRLGSTSVHALDLLAPFFFFGLLEFGYQDSKDSAAIIRRNLERSLSQ